MNPATTFAQTLPIAPPELTARLLATLAHEQRALQEENEQTIGALDATVDVQSRTIQAQSDEITLLRARLAQKEQELLDARAASRVQESFSSDQRALIAELRQNNSRLNESDLKLKELMALYTTLEATRADLVANELSQIINTISPYFVEGYKKAINRSVSGSFYEKIIQALQSSKEPAS